MQQSLYIYIYIYRETVIVDYDNYLYVKMFAPIIPGIHWLSWFM